MIDPTIFDQATNDLEAALNVDLDSANFVVDVLLACERLRAVMDLMRLRIEGKALH